MRYLLNLVVRTIQRHVARRRATPTVTRLAHELGMSPLTKSTAACAIALVAVACAHENSGPPATTFTTGARTVSPDVATTRLTTARCDREVACMKVGPGRRFLDRDACMREIGHDTATTLHADVCQPGIDDAKLSACIVGVRSGHCDDPLDAIPRIAACKASELCIGH
jgi:hypothetical protein